MRPTTSFGRLLPHVVVAYLANDAVIVGVVVIGVWPRCFLKDDPIGSRFYVMQVIVEFVVKVYRHRFEILSRQ